MSMSEPYTISLNGKSHALTGPMTLRDFLRSLQLNVQQIAVEVNQELVPREAHATHPIMAGDKLEIVTLVGGG